MNLDKIKVLGAKYALIVGVIVGAFLLVGGVAVFVYSAMQSTATTGDDTSTPLSLDGQGQDGSGQFGDGDFINAFAAPARTTALVLGIHPTGGISDLMLLVTFDSVTNKIDVVSIQRDTLITLPKEDVDALHALGRKMTPSSGNMKLGELHSYAGDVYGPEYVKKFVQNMLSVDIDYTVVISTTAFRNIVDAAGGVYMEVRAKGYHYSDPEQNLYIDIPGGYQKLDGKMAEGVVRYRHDYTNGDLDRIEVQQQFMKNFFEQVLNRETIKNNWPSFLSTVISYVKTDFTIDDIPKYLSSIDKLDGDNIEFRSLPGVAEYISGGWYYFYSPAEGRVLIDEIFSVKEAPAEEEAPQSNVIIDKTLIIQVLNGTYVNRLGAQKAEKLTDAGYKIKDTGTYQGVKQKETRIMVKDKDLGEQFKAYFNNAVVEVDINISSPYDVIIIIGTGEN